MGRRDLNRSIEIVEAVREAVGPDVDLLIEGHGRFTPGTAVEVADRIAPFDPFWFEEPCPPDNVDGLRKVAERSRVPIATGERAVSKHAFRDLVSETDVDVVQPDLSNCGGITEGQKIAAIAEADHVSFAPHNPQGPVATAVAAHLDASTPNFAIQETFEDYDIAWKDDLLVEPIRIEDGFLQVPEGPGLGVELDMDAVEDHAYTGASGNRLDLFAEGWDSP
jgi:galactonate dehydratase